MVEQRIQQQFIDSADLTYQWAQTLARPVMDALQALLACVTGGGKVLVCGTMALRARWRSSYDHAAGLLYGDARPISSPYRPPTGLTARTPG